jgi:hypothetical protein
MLALLNSPFLSRDIGTTFPTLHLPVLTILNMTESSRIHISAERSKKWLDGWYLMMIWENAVEIARKSWQIGLYNSEAQG